MDFNSPHFWQEGALHGFWDLFYKVLIGVLLAPLVKKFWKPVSKKSTNFKLKLILTWFYRLASSVVVALLLTATLIQVAQFAQPRPNLKADVDGSSLGISDVNPRLHSVVFRVKIYNSGSPSIVRDWSLKVKGADQKPIATQFLGMQQPFPFTATDNHGNVSTKIEKSDTIMDKVDSVPIPEGGSQEGWIIFFVPDLSRDFLQTGGTSYELSFKDVSGQNYIAPSFNWPLPAR